jgi:NADP-dependent aldehyde dehydrogenase
MGTVNPAVLTPAAATDPARLAEVAAGFVDSFTLGVGQFCTKPGLLLVPAGSEAAQVVSGIVTGRSGGWMLHGGMADGFELGVATLVEAGGVLRARGTAAEAGFAVAAAVLTAAAGDLQPGSHLLEECFGPVALVVEYRDVEEAKGALGRLQPSLAGSVLSAGPQDPDLPALVSALASQVGRVLVDGWPTGVACADTMQHGGPWPATSRPDATSVGGHALARFLRPVAFQGVPASALPEQAR